MSILGAPSSAGIAAGGDALDGLLVQPLPEPVPAPPVAFEDLSGRPLTLRELRGNVIFVNFWATWCGPCRTEMPTLENLYRTYRGRGFVVVGVNFKESARDARALAQNLRLSFPVVLDPDGAASEAFRVRGLPVSFLLDREGRVLWRAIGSREWDGPHGRAYLDELLGPGAR